MCCIIFDRVILREKIIKKVHGPPGIMVNAICNHQSKCVQAGLLVSSVIAGLLGVQAATVSNQEDGLLFVFPVHAPKLVQAIPGIISFSSVSLTSLDT